MSRLYSSLYKSVVRAVNDLVKDIQTTMPDQTVRYWAWEDRMDEEKLPRETLIGVNGFTFHENLQMWLISFGVTLSTIDDSNLLTEAAMIDMIHDHFGEKQKIDMLDPDDGTLLSELVTVDFQVMPMTPTLIRNYRSIGIELRRTGSATV